MDQRAFLIAISSAASALLRRFNFISRLPRWLAKSALQMATRSRAILSAERGLDGCHVGAYAHLFWARLQFNFPDIRGDTIISTNPQWGIRVPQPVFSVRYYDTALRA